MSGTIKKIHQRKSDGTFDDYNISTEGIVHNNISLKDTYPTENYFRILDTSNGYAELNTTNVNSWKYSPTSYSYIIKTGTASGANSYQQLYILSPTTGSPSDNLIQIPSELKGKTVTLSCTVTISNNTNTGNPIPYLRMYYYSANSTTALGSLIASKELSDKNGTVNLVNTTTLPVNADYMGWVVRCDHRNTLPKLSKNTIVEFKNIKLELGNATTGSTPTYNGSYSVSSKELMQRGIYYSQDSSLSTVYTGRVYKIATLDLNPGTYIIEASVSVIPTQNISGGLIGISSENFSGTDGTGSSNTTYNNQKHVFPRGQIATINSSPASTSTNSINSQASITTIINSGVKKSYYCYIVVQCNNSVTVYPQVRYLQLPKCFTQN